MPLVLAQNELSESGSIYEDRTGVSYQYPANYRRLIQTGERFVYYRGRKTRAGRAPQVYFGAGTVGPIRQSPGAPDRLACDVLNYKEFAKPIFFKDAAGTYFEAGAVRRGYFQKGVRRISEDEFQRILSNASMPLPADLSDLKPKSRLRVMDLVRSAGVDVGDWENFRGGKAKAATNPKYCYEWSFIEPGKLVVLNLWFQNMLIEDDVVIQRLNLRRRAGTLAQTPNEAVWKARALRMDRAIQTAYENGLPIRVIVCDGTMRGVDDETPKASQVRYRLLDQTQWAATHYDFRTGQCVLERGATPSESDGHPGDHELEGFEGMLRTRFIVHRQREARFRARKIQDALRNYAGRLICEVPRCGFDFVKRYGDLGTGYAQVHHKIPLSTAPIEGRKVGLKDLAIVCANCHAMIHRGGQCRAIEQLIPRVSDLSQYPSR